MGKKKRGEAKSKKDDDTDIPSSTAQSGYASAVNPYEVHVDRSAVDDVQHELDMKHALEQQPLERDRLLLTMSLGSLSVRQRSRYWSLCAEHANAARASGTNAAPSKITPLQQNASWRFWWSRPPLHKPLPS